MLRANLSSFVSSRRGAGATRRRASASEASSILSHEDARSARSGGFDSDDDGDDDDRAGSGWDPSADPFAGEGELFAHTGQNEVYFYCGVTRRSVRALIRTMERLRITEGMRAVKEGRPPRPVTLRISSEGGSLHDGLAAHDWLRARFPDLVTVADGLCASAGTFLLLAGTDRRVQPNAFVLVHQLREEIGGTMTNTEIQDLATVNSGITGAMRRLYRAHTRIPDERLDTLFTREVYLDADECVRHGIAHRLDGGAAATRESAQPLAEEEEA